MSTRQGNNTMTKINSILNSIEVTNPKFIGSKFEDWSNTPATRKGFIGEQMVQAILESHGHKVSQRITKEHDLIVNGKKVEIKTAFLKRDKDVFSFYGYDATEDPHYWLLQLVSPDNITIVKMDRKAMAGIHLGKTRKNTMFTVTLDDLIAAGGDLVAITEVY